MINLNRIFEVWFADPEITPARKLSFADRLRDRLTEHNANGVFDIILPELDGAITAAGGATSSEAVALAVRKAAVQAKVTLMENMKDLISRRSGRIADAFGKNSVEYTEFFPQGVKAYREMTEQEVIPGLDTILAAAAKYDAAMVTEFQALKTSWLAALQAAGNKSASASARMGEQDAALAALDMVLMKVVFTAGLAFTGKEAMGPLLFEQSRLYPAGSGAEPDAPAAPVTPSA